MTAGWSPLTLRLTGAVAAQLRAELGSVAEQTVAAVIREVPSYADALAGDMGPNIARAVRMAMGGFLGLVAQSEPTDPSAPLQPALEAAYALGRGEARSGRTVIALLAAYRVGARVAWRGLAHAAVEGGLEPQPLVTFAELVFAYIDQLSAASVAGHSDELATTGRVRQRYLEELARALFAADPDDVVTGLADRAGWPLPESLTAVVLPGATFNSVPAGLHPQTLRLDEDATETTPRTTLLLVPDADALDRPRLVRLLADRPAVIGPARPWREVRISYLRAVRTSLVVAPSGHAVDTEAHLTDLVLGADPEALVDLRRQVLAPLADLRPDVAAKLRQTLRSWLLHHGRRADIAADLYVHPQTVRYRMGQLRELYGDRLADPATILQLTVALAGSDPGAGPNADPHPDRDPDRAADRDRDPGTGQGRSPWSRAT